METLTMSSEEFRLNWGNSVHKALSGHQVVIERYGKPALLVLNYEHFQVMQQRLKELEREVAEREFERRFAEIRAGNYVELTLTDIEEIEREIACGS
jgi:hypothetical protein